MRNRRSGQTLSGMSVFTYSFSMENTYIWYIRLFRMPEVCGCANTNKKFECLLVWVNQPLSTVEVWVAKNSHALHALWTSNWYETKYMYTFHSFLVCLYLSVSLILIFPLPLCRSHLRTKWENCYMNIRKDQYRIEVGGRANASEEKRRRANKWCPIKHFPSDQASQNLNPTLWMTLRHTHITYIYENLSSLYGSLFIRTYGGCNRKSQGHQAVFTYENIYITNVNKCSRILFVIVSGFVRKAITPTEWTKRKQNSWHSSHQIVDNIVAWCLQTLVMCSPNAFGKGSYVNTLRLFIRWSKRVLESLAD